MTKEEMAKRVSDFIVKLEGEDISVTEIAYRLGMSYSSVQGWKAMRRVPKKPVIEQLQTIFRRTMA